MSSELDARISSAWDGEPPPARDALFRLAVMARIERRRYHRNLVLVCALGLAGSILFWFALPRLMQEFTQTVSATSMLAIMVIAGLSAAAWGMNRVYKVI